MNLIEAIKSGKPRRCPTSQNEEANRWHSCEHVRYWLSDIVMDWETQEPTVTITRTQLNSAIVSAVEHLDLTQPFAKTMAFGEGHPTWRAVGREIARRLGLEPGA